MIATLIGIFASLAVVVGVHMSPEFEDAFLFPDTLFAFLFGAFLLFSLLPWIWAIFLTLNTETSVVSSAAVRSNLKDRRMVLLSGAVIALCFAGIIVVSQPLISLTWSFGLCAVLLGTILDLLRAAYLRLQTRRLPEGVADWLVETMREAVRKHDEKLYTLSFETVFTLIIEYMRSGRIGSLRLFTAKILGASDLWLGSIAKIGLFRVPTEHEETFLDRYSLAEARTAKRLAWVVHEACAIGNPTAVEESVRLIGRLFLIFHAYHASLGFLLLMALSQTSQKMEETEEKRELDVEISSAFSEVIKALVDRSIERRTAETATIAKVLAILETHVKELFRREKGMNPALLMQPFAEIGQMVGSERYQALADRDEIIAHLRRILAQFAALETVAGRLEISGEGTDTKASFHEDLPFTLPRTPADEPPAR